MRNYLSRGILSRILFRGLCLHRPNLTGKMVGGKTREFAPDSPCTTTKITEMKNYYRFGQVVDKNPIFALHSDS